MILSCWEVVPMKKIAKASRDRDIRVALRVRFAARHGADENAVVVEELPVAGGASRLDMAIINGRIEGVEIKSSRDTLDRLRRQVALYSPALDRGMLVAAPEHLDEAADMVPDWWAIYSAEIGSRGAVRLRRIRRGKPNPQRCARAFLDLLERDEIVGLLAGHALDKGFRTAARAELAGRAIDLLSPTEIFNGVRRQLKIRAYLAAKYSRSAFGETAGGGGVAATAPTFMDAIPAE